MADITVKASNGTTDVVYAALSPSAGDSVAAQWGVTAASAVPAFRPRFRAVSKDNAAKTTRIFNFDMTYPITDTVNGVLTQVASVPLTAYVALPVGVDATKVKEAYYQFGNLLVATLVRSSLDSGFAPT